MKHKGTCRPVVAAAERAGLVFDVGLHRGEDAAFYLAMGYRVIGFEANPDLVRVCRERFRSEIRQGRLEIVEGAIQAGPASSVTFYQHPLSVWGTTRSEWVRRNSKLGASRVIEVPSVNFSAALHEHGIPHYLKIDIEGSDKICLQALRNFDHRPAYVSMESEKQSFSELVAEFELLETLGYDRFAVVQQARVKAHPTTITRIDGTTASYTFEPDASGPFGVDVGPWMTREKALTKYRSIFRQYRLFGDESILQRTTPGRMLRAQVEKRLGRPLPGWYDTHAALSTK